MANQTEIASIKISHAREQLSTLVDRVQNPRHVVVLTRYGRSMGAIVSMSELKRIWKQQDMEDIIHKGRRPSMFTFGTGFACDTNQEAAEHIQQLQLSRRTEREVLTRAGLEVVPGGELTEELVVRAEPEGVVGEVRGKRWWWFW